MFPQRFMPRRSAPSQTSDTDGSQMVRERGPVTRLFSRRSRVVSVEERVEDIPESPKTPRPTLGLHNLPSTRLDIPHLHRNNSNTSVRSHGSSSTRSFRSARHRQPESQSQSQLTTVQEQSNLSPPTSVSIPPEAARGRGRRFVGVDPAELHLAELAEAGRRRRRHRSRGRTPRCLPRIKNRRIRSKLLSCFISGLFLTLVLTIYLALALSNRDESQEFHVLLILIILITTVFFCHALIRLCMMIIHPPPENGPVNDRMPGMIGPGGYANPVVPIRVALARDEEAAGIESDATKFPPPAYGLWRESVRVDPNRIFWQRNEEAAQAQRGSNQASSSESRPATARPPSYISDDGISYVVEAAPRSIAPSTDVPLPVHPSERGRAGGWPMP